MADTEEVFEERMAAALLELDSRTAPNAAERPTPLIKAVVKDLLEMAESKKDYLGKLKPAKGPAKKPGEPAGPAGEPGG